MTQRNTRLYLTLLVLGSFALRVYQLDRSNFRGDEAFTVQYWMLPALSEALTTYITLDPQPPLAYAAYNLWGQWVGFSEFAVRVLPALAGVLGVPLMYQLALQFTGRRVLALLAALLWAVHPFLVWHGQDARNYALWSTVSLLGLFLALRAIAGNRPRDWVAYVITAAIAGYLYYLEVFVFVALSVYVLLAYPLRWRTYYRWVGAMLTVGSILAPWYLQPQIRSGGGYGGTTTGFQLQKLFVEFPTALTLGSTLPPALEDWLWGVVLVLLVLGIVLSARHNGRLALFVGTLGLVPPVLLALLSLRLNVLAPRYVLASVPAYTLLIALLLYAAFRYRRWVGAGALGVWLGLCGVSLYRHYAVEVKAPQWTALSAYLGNTVDQDHLVIQTSTDPAFGYYYNVVYRVPADERALPAAPNQPTVEIHTQLAQVSAEYDAVWLAAQGFTDWASYGVVEAWMDAHMQRVIDTNAAGLRAQQYRPWDVAAGEIRVQAPLTTFADTAALADVRVFTPPQPTGELVVWVYWHPLEQTETPLKAFVHLTGDINPTTNTPLWSQDDHEPQHGRAATTTWQPGTLYRDVFVLPGVDGVPGADYTLTLGLYQPDTGERLLTATGDDAYTITTVQLP